MQRPWGNSVHGMCEEEQETSVVAAQKVRGEMICVCSGRGNSGRAVPIGPCSPLTLEFALREMGKNWKVLHKSNMTPHFNRTTLAC